MGIYFYKYQGTGNDFILLDTRATDPIVGNQELIKKMCDRHFSIGADGLMLLRDVDGFDFEMVYYNSDGLQSTMCGNGGRCMIKFAQDLGIISDSCSFLAVDGPHSGQVLDHEQISLGMKDVKDIFVHDRDFIIDTGSPHFVHFTKDLAHFPVVPRGRAIRYSEAVGESGINVNFVEVLSEGSIFVRTYERGVEDETLSCGTGVVASALAYHYSDITRTNKIHVQTMGGDLTVSFLHNSIGYSQILLTGPAIRTFEGRIELDYLTK